MVMVCGQGINDMKGKDVPKKIYKTWQDMLRRCYSDKRLKRYPTYSRAEVCEEWKLFSNFYAWMAEEDYQGKVLDKDLLSRHKESIYSPDTCLFIDYRINSFLNINQNTRNGLLGVRYPDKNCKSFSCSIQDPFLGKIIRFSGFNSAMEAHKKWQSEKHRIAKHFISEGYVEDKKACEALLDVFSPERDYTNM